MSLAEIPVEEILAHLGKEGYIVRTKDQDNEFWGKKEGEVIGGKLKEWSENLESKIKDITKIERNDQENALAYLERTVGSINDSSSTVSQELDALRKSAANGNEEAAEIQKQFEAFKKVKQKEVEELTGKLGGLEQNAFDSRIKTAVSDALGKIRPSLKKDKDQEKIYEAAVQNEISKFYNEVKAVDHQGGLIYHDKDDKPLIDQVTGNHLGAFDILNGRLDYLVDKTRNQGGSGGAGEFGGADGDNKYKLSLPPEVKTKVALTAYLTNEKKIDPNQGEFNKYFKESGAELPLR